MTKMEIMLNILTFGGYNYVKRVDAKIDEAIQNSTKLTQKLKETSKDKVLKAAIETGETLDTVEIVKKIVSNKG